MCQSQSTPRAIQALRLQRQGKIHESILLYKESISRHDERHYRLNALISLSVSLSAIGNLYEALLYIDLAYCEFRDSAEAAYLKGDIQLALAQYDESLPSLRKAASVAPLGTKIKSMALASIAMSAAKLEMHDIAIEAIRSCDYSLLSDEHKKRAFLGFLLCCRHGMLDFDRMPSKLCNSSRLIKLLSKTEASTDVGKARSLVSQLKGETNLEKTTSINLFCNEVVGSLVFLGDISPISHMYNFAPELFDSVYLTVAAADSFYSLGNMGSARNLYTKAGVHNLEGGDLSAMERRARLNWSRACLCLGIYTPDVWSAFEERISVANITGKKSSDIYPALPRWEPNKGYTRLLIGREQGIGEELLFASFLPLFLMQYPDVILSVEVHPKIYKIIKKRFDGSGIKIYYTGQQIDNGFSLFDSFLHLGSICHFLNTLLLQDFMSDKPKHLPRFQNLVIKSSAHSKRQINTKAYDHGPRIGLYWRSSGSPIAKDKSLALPELSTLLDLPFTFVSLQDSLDEAEENYLHKLGIDIPDFDCREEIESLSNLVASLDMVVTISSFVAHLSCWHGKCTAVITSASSGKMMWYWGDHGERSPYYGSAHIFRGIDRDTLTTIESVRSFVVDYFS